MSVIILLGWACLAWAGLLAIRANLALRNNHLQLEKRTKQPKTAVLIAARYESAVIEGLLKSIQKQTVTVKMRDVYVIIETLEDPTVQICRRYGCSVIVRTHPERQRKGYALDEAVKQILKKHHYDLYFVFDADNRLAPTYVEEMLKVYAMGYQMATGYREAKNGNKNVIAAVSSLTFSMINTLGNKKRIRYGANIIFSGTGCYVDGELVEMWHGWPFHSLTEDYEMSLYAMLRNISTYYNERAVFYDEQPTKYRQTVDQRVRWIKGYFEARKLYLPRMRKRKSMSNDGSLVKERIGVMPVIWALIGVVAISLGDIVALISMVDVRQMTWMLVGVIVSVYLILMLVTIVMIWREKVRFSGKMTLGAILFNPLYLLSYVPCAVRAFTRKVEWKRIEHGN